MHFDEGRRLNQSHCRISEIDNRTNPTHERDCELSPRGASGLAAAKPSSARSSWRTQGILDATNNTLQELMQLFYLLSRDPAIPSEARFHVTVAQSEIALLTRQLQNVVGPNVPRDTLPEHLASPATRHL
jgi:hypothetical protein